MKNDQPTRRNLTPDESARIKREVQERLEGWTKALSPEEAEAWLDARIDDLEAEHEALVQEMADFTSIRQIVAPIIREHPNMRVREALELIRKKHQKTLAEAEALDAFERIKNKPLRAE